MVCLYRFREAFVLTGWHGALMCVRLPLQFTQQTPRPSVIRDAPCCQHRRPKRGGGCVRPLWKFQHWERALVPPMSQLSCNFDSCWCYTTHKESSCVRRPFRVNFEGRCISGQELTSLHSISYRNTGLFLSPSGISERTGSHSAGIHVPFTNCFVCRWFCVVYDPKPPLHSHNWLSFGKFQDIERFLIHCERHFSSRLAVEPGSKPRSLVQKKPWRDSVPIDMHLSAVSVLVVAQSSSEIPEGLMNSPVYRENLLVQAAYTK